MKAKKIFIVLIIIASFSYIFQINVVQAALQSSGNTPAKKDRNTWMTQARAMENLGGGFGLTETQNADLTSSSGSNNIDIHMQKNTEYGAMALLSASSYGNPNKIEDGGTTTGNKSGVVIPYINEWTATQFTDTIGKTSYADRYINYYVAANYEKKRGDATIETQGWHGTTYLWSLYSYNSSNSAQIYNAEGLVRNRESGIFGYWNRKYMYEGYGFSAGLSKAYYSRAVIINGEGI